MITRLLTNFTNHIRFPFGETNFLKVETGINIGFGKNIFVLTAGRERFLIYAGIGECRLLVKLEDNAVPDSCENNGSGSEFASLITGINPQNVLKAQNMRKNNIEISLSQAGIRENNKPAEKDKMADIFDFSSMLNAENMDYIGLKKILR